MVDYTKKMVETAMLNDGTITKAQRAAVIALLEGRAPTTEPVPRVYSQQETADLFGVTPKCCRDWERKGLLKAVRLGPKRKRGIGYTEASVRAITDGTAFDGEKKKRKH